MEIRNNFTELLISQPISLPVGRFTFQVWRQKKEQWLDFASHLNLVGLTALEIFGIGCRGLLCTFVSTIPFFWNMHQFILLR